MVVGGGDPLLEPEPDPEPDPLPELPEPDPLLDPEPELPDPLLELLPDPDPELLLDPDELVLLGAVVVGVVEAEPAVTVLAWVVVGVLAAAWVFATLFDAPSEEDEWLDWEGRDEAGAGEA